VLAMYPTCILLVVSMKLGKDGCGYGKGTRAIRGAGSTRSGDMDCLKAGADILGVSLTSPIP